MRPEARELQALITTLGEGVKGQKQLINDSIVANEQSGVAQIQGLEAKKTQAFGQIEQGASDKGMFFSGFSPDQQAKYTSATYLPALAQLQATIAGTRAQLMGKGADIDSGIYRDAFQAREGDIQAGRNWDSAERDRQHQAELARQQAERQAAEAERQRQFEASEGNKNRAVQAAGNAGNAGPSTRELFASELGKSAGKDGKVSPGAYNALKNQYVAAGYGSYKDFHDQFWKFANDKHWWDYR